MGESKIKDSICWVPVDGIILEDNALNAVKSNRNLLIVAGPGAGKTELLAQKACYLLQTNTTVYPQKILAISFKKDAAENLAERVLKRSGPGFSERFVSKTFDSFAKGIVDNFLNGLPEEYRPSRNYNIAIQDRKRNDIKRAFDLAGAQKASNLNDKDYVKALNNVIVRERLPITVRSSGTQKVFNAWQYLLKGECDLPPSLSFQMISRLAEYLVRTNPLVKKALLQTYSHVFLDEFQDTTDLQYDLLKTCFYNTGSKVTAVGDNKQRIMLWARAKADIFDSYKAEFNALEKRLEMNHRSAPRLVEIQKIVYSYLNESNLNIKISNKWGKDDGVSEVWMFTDNQTESNEIASNISKLIKEQNISARDVCILVKQLPDNYGDLIIKSLKKVGIVARNEGKYQDLLKEEVIILLINSLRCILYKNDAFAWNAINDFIINKVGDISNNNFARYSMVIKETNEFFLRIMKILVSINNYSDLERIIWSIVDFYEVKIIKSIYTKYNQGTYVQELILDFIELIWQEYDECKNWKTAIDNFLGLNSIPIMTIHKSKGLEFSTVFFVGLEDSAFWNYVDQREEDICAFFVALSRAKERLYFTTSDMRDKPQRRKKINELYQILSKSKVVTLKDYRNK